MREIKFRGQTCDTPPHWVFGDLYHYTTGEPAINYPNPHKKWLESEPVRPDTVGQYTGLKDSNGKEIYEGDVLSLREGRDEMIEVIDFYAAITALDLSEMMNLRLLDYYFERGEVHVIGNVHDNPELLEVEA